MFLRGVGGNAAALGVQQGDAIRNITGYIDQNKSGYYEVSGSLAAIAGGVFRRERGTQTGNNAAHSGVTDRYSFDASRVVPTAYENRPVNKAVRYLIRAKS